MTGRTIVVDRDIPFIAGVFEPWFKVRYLAGRAIVARDVRDAVALVVRTRTRCDAQLLAGSSVKLVATATIGTDHIDMAYCAAQGIAVVSAPGCNAAAVAQYVLAALCALSLDRPGATLGIVGVGHVGSLVADAAARAGLRMLLNDPPREAVEGPAAFTPLPELLAVSDIVTLHIPLWPENRDFADAAFFAAMKSGASFINASRGEVVDEAALLRARPKLGAVVIDTWCNEPDVNQNLMDVCDVATPHIAGYSYQGKQMGTAMAVRSVARHFGIDALESYFPETESEDLEPIHLAVAGKSQGEITALIQYNYPIFTDDFFFRSDPLSFERLRSEYRYRREFYID